MKRKIVISFSLILTFFISKIVMAGFNKRKVLHCGKNAEKEIKAALKFLDNNIGTIIKDVPDLAKKEKKRLKKKLGNLNFKCMDHKRVCKIKADRGGKSRHIFRQAVVICYNNIRTFTESKAFCQLADTLLHEAAHAAGVKKERGHNNGPNDDRVYRVGLAAYDLCDDLGLNREVSKNTNN